MQRLLRHHARREIELLDGDIATIDNPLPDRISVCLLDFGMDIPTHEGLTPDYS